MKLEISAVSTASTLFSHFSAAKDGTPPAMSLSPLP